MHLYAPTIEPNQPTLNYNFFAQQQKKQLNPPPPTPPPSSHTHSNRLPRHTTTQSANLNTPKLSVLTWNCEGQSGLRRQWGNPDDDQYGGGCFLIVM